MKMVTHSFEQRYTLSLKSDTDMSSEWQYQDARPSSRDLPLQLMSVPRVRLVMLMESTQRVRDPSPSQFS